MAAVLKLKAGIYVQQGDGCLLYAFTGHPEGGGMVEEATTGWNVYDSTTIVWIEQAGVRVVAVMRSTFFRATRSGAVAVHGTLRAVHPGATRASVQGHRYSLCCIASLLPSK